MSEAATQERPVRIYLTLLGERHELVLPGYGWTYAEAKLAKAVSDGMAPVEIGQAFLNADPDAVMAIIRVTFARANRQLTPAELIQLAEIDLEEVAQAAMDGFQSMSNGNGASPTKPAEAGEPTNPAGLSTKTDDASPEQPSNNTDAPRPVSLLPEFSPTDPTASVAAGHPSSDTS